MGPVKFIYGSPNDYFHDDAVTVQVESDFARLLRMRQVGIDNVMFRAVEELPPEITPDRVLLPAPAMVALSERAMFPDNVVLLKRMADW